MCGLIVRVRVVPRRTVVGDIDRRFDNLSGSHHQSHVNCVSSVYGIYISGQLSRDVIGCFKVNYHPQDPYSILATVKDGQMLGKKRANVRRFENCPSLE